ncbi:MAG: hypothetical protein U1E45_10720 [Geminicoccaceae bacterium]
MAARRLDLTVTPGPREMPPSPASSPAVIAAGKLVDLAQKARDSAAQALAAAEAAAEAGDDVVAAEALDRLAKGQDLVVDDTDARAELDAARRRLAAAELALVLAKTRWAESLATAREAFRVQMTPLLRQALHSARDVIAMAVQANDRLREVCTYANLHDAEMPPPWAMAYPMPTGDKLEFLTQARDELLTPRKVEPAAGTVAIKMLIDTALHRAGDRIGLPEQDAVTWIRSGVAAPVDEAVARRLKVDNLVRFDRPQKVRVLKDFVPVDGTWTPSGTETVFDAATASRLVNMSYGVSLGDAHAY